MRVLVTGGCGYKGSVLVPKLLALGHEVVVWDIQWFGNYLKSHHSLRIERVDIRDPLLLPDVEAIIHMAGVANDPCGELDPKLTWEINALGTMRLADLAARSGVGRFLFASSGSVYGVKGDIAVDETELCVPISEYNKAKMVAERCVLSYRDFMNVAIIRPGTVCGWSPRQRLDISVNGLTLQALTHRKIRVGGSHLWRSNVHIEDITNLYAWLLDNPEIVGTYNAAFENVTLGDIAKQISSRIECKVEEVPVTDARSYRISSGKIVRSGFKPKHNISDAIDKLIEKYRANELKDEPQWHNLLSMPR